MGMSRVDAVPVRLAPDLKLTLKVRNRTPKPAIGTVVRRGKRDDLVFVTRHASMRESDLIWFFRKIVFVGAEWILDPIEYEALDAKAQETNRSVDPKRDPLDCTRPGCNVKKRPEGGHRCGDCGENI